jgi:hypothetical protein
MRARNETEAEFITEVRAELLAEIKKELDNRIEKSKRMLSPEFDYLRNQAGWKARIDELEDLKEWIDEVV